MVEDDPEESVMKRPAPIELSESEEVIPKKVSPNPKKAKIEVKEEPKKVQKTPACFQKKPDVVHDVPKAPESEASSQEIMEIEPETSNNSKKTSKQVTPRKKTRESQKRSICK